MAKPQLETKRPRVALVGGDTLLGRELQEVLASRAARPLISTFSANGEGSLSEHEGESVYIQPLEADALRNQQALFLAGAADGARKAYDLVNRAGGVPPIVDCNGHLESEPEARIVSPLLQPAAPDPSAWLYVIAHPAATALLLALTRLNRANPVRRTIAHIFEPASERGKPGVSELHRQTTSLLSFKPLDKQIFDAQLSFNLLAQYGEEAPGALSSIEQRIERHVATLLAAAPQDPPLPIPSLRLLQAPVFHGYSISLWIRFEQPADVTALSEALASAQIEVRGREEEAPTSVGAAGQSGLIAGDLRIDHNDARAAWFWIVGDNLRLTADSAADLFAALAPTEP